MSIFTVPVSIGPPDGGDWYPVDAAGDTGAAHSMLPGALLAGLNIAPRQQLGFIRADGRRVRYGFRVARFRIDDQERPGAVIFRPDNNYLPGASALAMFNLLVDPSGELRVPAKRLRLGWGGPLESQSPAICQSSRSI